jgi:hypothetical protein
LGAVPRGPKGRGRSVHTHARPLALSIARTLGLARGARGPFGSASRSRVRACAARAPARSRSRRGPIAPCAGVAFPLPPLRTRMRVRCRPARSELLPAAAVRARAHARKQRASGGVARSRSRESPSARVAVESTFPPVWSRVPQRARVSARGGCDLEPAWPLARRCARPIPLAPANRVERVRDRDARAVDPSVSYPRALRSDRLAPMARSSESQSRNARQRVEGVTGPPSPPRPPVHDTGDTGDTALPR